ncbi:hypothetical protein PF011_g23501 [Phytophthora fragariae]|uniref:Ankyrin repeat-containing domain n=1 Tax=Phytophthora fragariae TaxID=53985 RepID=A0A6A3I8M6_9STRA|nr:hypothetical protein PF011_g23501 [Phytophthora fragariae]
MASGPSSSFHPSFLCVDVVLREFPRVEALDHVAQQLKSLLDVSKVLSVAVAAQHQPLGSQSLTLLEHAALREKKKLSSWSSELKRSYKQFQFETALNNAAARGFFAGVKWLRSKYHPKGKFHGAERAAMYNGDLDMLRFLHDEFSNKMVEDAAVDSQDAVAHAAANGRLDLVQWYCKMKGPYAFGWSVMDAAVALDHMDVVQYLDSVMGNRCTRRGLEMAARNGHLRVVRWLNDARYYEIRTFRSLENAIAGGHLHLVKYVMENVVVAYTSWTQAALTAAVSFGQRHILQWLHDRAAVAAAAHNRHFRFEIHTNELRAHAVRGAAAGGHKEIIEWMEETLGCLARQRHRIRVDGAAGFGDLQFVQWLHHQGYRFTIHAMDDAAAGGYLSINRKEGCTTAAMDNAARNGHFEVVKFLYENRSEYCTAMAGESRSVAVLAFLKKNNCLRSRLPKTTEAATRGDLDLLQWLYAHDRRHFGYEAVVDEARERNHFHLLRWLETLPEAGRYF